MFIVTGANGFIGSALVWELNNTGITDIICSDSVSLQERPLPLKKAKYQKFLNHEELLNFVNTDPGAHHLQCIFHMGACSDTTEMNVDYLKENNTLYTNQLFKRCAELNIPYIYASSGAVYGDGQQGFDDNTPPEEFTPLNPYGDSKLESDKWILQQKTTPPRWYGLRFFNVFGPNEYHKKSMRSLAHKAFDQINEKSSLKLFRSHNPDYEDGKQMRDFVYVKDITRWMLELYKAEKVSSGIYNLGFGTARTWLDLAGGVFKNMNKELNIDWIDIPENLRDQYQYYTEANIDKLKKQKLSTPQWPLEKAIDDYFQNYLLTEDPFL